MNHKQWLWVLSLSILAAGTNGCGSKRAATVAVTGTVTYKNDPVEGAAVLFTRDDGPPATGETDAQGTFTLTTYEPKDGAIPADYSVAITKMESAPPAEGDGRIPAPATTPPKSLLPKKYRDPRTSELKETVAPGTPNSFTFDLTD